MIPDTTQFPAFLAGVAQGRQAGLAEAAKVCDDMATERREHAAREGLPRGHASICSALGVESAAKMIRALATPL